jgi:endoglucanase
MKRPIFSLIFLLILISFISACQSGKTDEKVKTFPYKSFSIMRGTNVAHWLSQSERRGEERKIFFTEKDVRYIDSLGFDHIRIPIDEEQMWDEKGIRHEDAFTLLNNSLEWSRKAGLRVVVDLHILRSHHFNAKEKPLWTVPAEQDKFIRLWKDLSSFLHGWPNAMVAYEFMNEPVADDAEQWNVLLARVDDSIRKWEPLRVLVIGSNRWQSANTFDQLRIPKNDTNIVLSFHFYEPFFLTHYHAGWTNLKDFNGEVSYPGQIVLNSKIPEQQRVYNRDTLLKMMQKPLHLADSLKLPLYCGEFGVYENFFPESKLAWYTDMVSIFNEHKIAFANWNYKSGAFGIVDDNMKPLLPVIRILTSSKGK